MSAMAAFFASIFSGLFTFFATYFGKKVAMGAAIISVCLAITTAFFIAIKALVAGILYQVTNEWVLMAFYMVWPSNAEVCISACISAEVAAFLYRMHMDTVRTVSGAQ